MLAQAYLLSSLVHQCVRNVPLSFVLFAQGNRPVGFECDNEVFIQSIANKLQVFL